MINKEQLAKDLTEANKAHNVVLKLFTEIFRPVFGNEDHIRIAVELDEIRKQENVVKNLLPHTAARLREFGILVDKKKQAVFLIGKINEAIKI